MLDLSVHSDSEITRTPLTCRSSGAKAIQVGLKLQWQVKLLGVSKVHLKPR